MHNIFIDYPEFITEDVRQDRKNVGGEYTITSEFQYKKHMVTMPESFIKNKTVLDLGCCTGASGAWVLSFGCKRYVGIELQTEFCNIANRNLNKYFSGHDWEIKEQSLTDFFKNNSEQFDIVIAYGIIYHSVEVQSILKDIANLNCEHVLIDCFQPKEIVKTLIKRGIVQGDIFAEIRKLSYIELSAGSMVSEQAGQLTIAQGTPSENAVKNLMEYYGYSVQTNHTSELWSLFPSVYSGNRYNYTYIKKDKSDNIDFERAYNNKELQQIQKFNDGIIDKMRQNDIDSWVFGSDVADIFQDHARKHIPDYDKVIRLCVDICMRKVNKDSRIIDIGCALGETVQQLSNNGFTNIVGVDSSKDMLDKIVNKDTIEYVLSDTLPKDNYDVVLCNWTMHFISDKISYLRDIYNSLNTNGFLILTDKTCNSGLDLELYHDFKRNQGVSNKEIRDKAESIKNVMFIDTPQWYFDILNQLGFKNTSIINAVPCFTTFICYK
jgi:tRNA (cmo5U34)-methyltransferase